MGSLRGDKVDQQHGCVWFDGVVSLLYGGLGLIRARVLGRLLPKCRMHAARTAAVL
jgi:hypothetical protein